MKLILSISLFISQFVSADLHLTTLDDWQIVLYGKGALMVAKSNEEPEKHKSILAFHVERPLCIATDPILMLESKSNSFLDKDIIFAKMTIDKNKARNLKLEKSFGFDDKEKQDTQINHFKFLKFPPFANGTYMKVTFDTRTQLNNFEMNLTGLKEAKYEAINICKSYMDLHTSKNII